jgi:ribosome-binding factor A
MTLHSRIKRINEELKEALARIIARELKDPRLAETMATVTEVEVTRDLRLAQVYVSVLGDDAHTNGVMEALNHSKGFIKRRLAEEVILRSLPDLVFHLDTSVRNAERINTLLREIEREDAKRAREEKPTGGE